MARIVCPRCANFVSSKDATCPFCGYELTKNKKPKSGIVSGLKNRQHIPFDENIKNVDDPQIDNLDFILDENIDDDLVTSESASSGEGDEPTLSTQKNENADDNVELGKEESERGEDSSKDIKKAKRHAHKKRVKEIPNVVRQEDGSYGIDTTDVTFFEGIQDHYSEKKALGEKKQPKIQWWEIYKWSDLYLARRKISKEVNKVAIVEPEYINHIILAFLCLFFGMFGIHNFYAKNYKKGFFVLISLIISLTVISIPQFEGVINVSVGGGLGFVVVALWIWDFIAILFRKYKFRESRLKFISKLNLETRTKLGKKYVNIREWFVPFEKKKKMRLYKRRKISEKK